MTLRPFAAGRLSVPAKGQKKKQLKSAERLSSACMEQLIHKLLYVLFGTQLRIDKERFPLGGSMATLETSDK